MSHRVRRQDTSDFDNRGHAAWENPFTGEVSHTDFWERFEGAQARVRSPLIDEIVISGADVADVRARAHGRPQLRGQPGGARGGRPLTGEPLAPKPVSAATRHVMQARQEQEHQAPSSSVRAALREAGLSGYRLHWKKAPGKPDICFPGRRVAIFVNGCFWHRCPHCGLSMPKSNVEFWEAKFARNRARDARDNALLVSGGWTVITIWECRLKKGRFDATMRALVREIRRAEELRAQGLRSGRLVEIGSAPAWRVRRERHRRRSRRG